MSFQKLLAVDRRTIPAKMACLLAYGILGSYLPYFNIFFISLGLSKSNAGIITGLTFLPPIVAGPLWGYLGDVTGRRRTILVVLCLGSAVLMFSTPWLASDIYPISKFNATQYQSCYDTFDDNTFYKLFLNDIADTERTSADENRATATLQPLTLHVENLTTTTTTTLITTTTALPSTLATTLAPLDCAAFLHHLNQLFWILLPLMLTASIFLVPLQPYMEAIVMEIVKTGTPGTSYGAQRIFGAIGLCLANFGAGKAAYYFQVPKDMSEYTAVFFIFLPCTILLIPVGCYMIGQLEDTKGSEPADVEIPQITTNIHGCNANEKSTTKKDPEPQSSGLQNSKSQVYKIEESVFHDLPDVIPDIIAKDPESGCSKFDSTSDIKSNTEESPLRLVVKLCCQFEVFLFLLTVLISGLAASVFLTFSYVYTKETLKKGYTEMTMVIVTANIAETLIFPFTEELIRLLRGPRVAIIVGLLAHAVRFAVMSQDVDFLVFVGVQSLSAFAFALSFAAMMEETHRISPNSISVTMVTVMTTTFFIVAMFVANIAGSLIYDRYGGKKLFLWQSWLCAGWCVLLLSYQMIKKCASGGISRDNTQPHDYASNHDNKECASSEMREQCQYYHDLGAYLP